MSDVFRFTCVWTRPHRWTGCTKHTLWSLSRGSTWVVTKMWQRWIINAFTKHPGRVTTQPRLYCFTATVYWFRFLIDHSQSMPSWSPGTVRWEQEEGGHTYISCIHTSWSFWDLWCHRGKLCSKTAPCWKMPEENLSYIYIYILWKIPLVWQVQWKMIILRWL